PLVGSSSLGNPRCCRAECAAAIASMPESDHIARVSPSLRSSLPATTRSLLTWPVPFVTMGPPATPFAAPRKGCLAAAVSCARGGPMMSHTVRGVFPYARHLGPYPTGDARRDLPSSWRAVGGLRLADRLVRGRGDDLHVYAPPHDERTALGPHRLRSQPDRARPAVVDVPDDHHRRQLRVHSSAE